RQAKLPKTTRMTRSRSRGPRRSEPLTRTQAYESRGQEFESLRQNPPFLRWKRRRARAAVRFRAHDAPLFRVDFDALSERAEVITTVAARSGPQPLTGLPGKRFGWSATFRVRSPRSHGQRSA